MKAAKINSAQQFDTRLYRNLGILSYGDNNDFPQVVQEILRASVTGAACLDIKKDFVLGMGLTDSKGGMIVNPHNDTISKVRDFLVSDLCEFNGVAIHVNYNALYKIRSITPIPFEHVRLCAPECGNDILRVAVNPDWTRRDKWRDTRFQTLASSTMFYDIYNPDADVIQAQVDTAGGWDNYLGQVLYITNTGSISYPIPSYVAALTAMRTEEGLLNVSARNVCSNFLPAGMVIDIKDIEQTEEQIQEKQNELNSFQGDENALQLWYTTARTKDEAPTFVPFAGENYDKAFSNTQSYTPDIIGSAFKQPPILRAKDVGANFGADLFINAYKYYNSVTVKERKIISDTLELLLNNWWLPVSDPDYSVQPLVYNAGSSIFERLGSDGMTKVIEIVNSTVSNVSKANLLRYGMGLTDEEINHLITTV